MGIDVRWDDDIKTIIYCQFDANWTLDDFHKMVDATYQLSTSVTYPVSVINDFSKSRVAPRQWLSTGGHIEKRQSPNTNLVFVVGASTFIEVMLNIARKLFLKDVPIYPVSTIQEAYRIIEKHKHIKVHNL